MKWNGGRAPYSLSVSRGLVLATSSISILTGSINQGAMAQGSDQNVLLIIADDLGLDSLGTYGLNSNVAPTPNIDALADNGVRFTSAWSYPVCSPTRAAMLTGRYGFRTGVGFTIIPNTPPQRDLSTDAFTIADGLTGSHATACIGKWNLTRGNTGNFGVDTPMDLGFDYFAGNLRAQISSYTNWPRTVNSATTDAQTANTTNYATTQNVDDAIDWISGQGGSPWFCWLAFNAPHSPFHRPPDNLHSFEGQLDGNLSSDARRRINYKAMIEAMDTEIGRLLDELDSLGVREDTHIIFMGDNGTPSEVAQSPFTAGTAKFSLNQGGINVPLIVSGPAVPQNREGSTSSALVTVTDLFSSVLELAGTEASTVVPRGVAYDSISLVPYLALPGRASIREYAVSEIFRPQIAVANGSRTIRNERFKYIRTNNGNNTFTQSFYDLTNDPFENNNLLQNPSLTADQQANFDELLVQLDNTLNGVASEAGELQWTRAEGWDTIYLTNSFENPVVVVGSPTANGGDPVTVRVRNFTSNAFEYQIDEWNYLDGRHGADETLSFWVVEEGSQTIAGQQVEAGVIENRDISVNNRSSTSSDWTTTSFLSSFADTPVVLAQCVTRNGGSAVTTRIDDVTEDSFRVRLQEEEYIRGAMPCTGSGNSGDHSAETIHYIAVEAGVASGSAFLAGMTGNGVTDNWSTGSISFGETVSTPLFLAAMQTYDGSDPSTVRYRNLTTTGAEVRIEEENSNWSEANCNGETGHTSEVVGWIVFDAE